MEFLRERAKNGESKGKLSFSRMFPFCYTVLLVVLWLSVGVGVIFGWTAWDTWEGYLTWGREYAVVTVIPLGASYVGRIGGGEA